MVRVRRPPTDLLPTGIYTIPEISMVGATEERLTERCVPYEVGTATYREIARGQIEGNTTGRLKLLFHCESLKLLGVHAIGDHAADLIHLGQTVMAFDGTIEYFINQVLNYPTYSECYRVAALNGVNRLYPWCPCGTFAAVRASNPSRGAWLRMQRTARRTDDPTDHPRQR